MSRRWPQLIALVVALTFLGAAAAACGGSDGATPAKTPVATSQAPASTPAAVATRTPTPERPPPTPTNQQLLAYTKQYVRTEWNFLSGSALPKDLYDMFLPECQKMVTVESLAKSPAIVQAAFPGLKGTFIQDITFQDTLGVKFVEGNQLQVVVPRYSQSTVTINGKQQNMWDWVKSISATTVQDESRGFRVVQAGANLKVSTCETLKQWSKE
jgi:hypothetical protein